MKKCSRCEIEKELIFFNKCRSKADGLMCWCKQCVKEYDSRRKEYFVQYNNSSAGKAARYKYMRTTKGKAAHKKYRDSEKGKVKSNKYRKSTKGRFADKRNFNNRRYYYSRTPKHLALTEIQWGLILYLFNSSCASCGATEDITIDHVIPLSKGGLNVVENVQPLCRSCNSKKYNSCVDYRPAEFLHLFFV